jgi:hypothetical protein
VLAVAYLTRAIPTARREGGALVPAFMAMTAIAILSLYDASLYYALPQSIFFACAAVIASRWGETAERKSHAGPVNTAIA